MSEVIFLGDVALLTDSVINEYRIEGDYVFNCEYVITNNPDVKIVFRTFFTIVSRKGLYTNSGVEGSGIPEDTKS